jgi:hypothetical protein
MSLPLHSSVLAWIGSVTSLFLEVSQDPTLVEELLGGAVEAEEREPTFARLPRRSAVRCRIPHFANQRRDLATAQD